MRLLIIAALLLAHFTVSAQEIANCVEILGPDSVKFYYRAGGNLLHDQECAQYYRIARMNHDHYIFDGHAQDYYISGQLAVDCRYSKNILHGLYTAYYVNGQIKETGQFKEGLKTGEWKYWHNNGQVKKVINFRADGARLQTLNKANGKPLVSNGNGEYTERELLSYRTIKGEIKNGRQHGKWTISNHFNGMRNAVEIFDNGKFVEGQNLGLVKGVNQKYFDKPNSTFDLTEDLLVSYDRKWNCPAQINFASAKYNSLESDRPFFDYVYLNFDPPKFSAGYIIAGFTINEYGQMTNIALHSTLSDSSVNERLRTVLKASDRWQPVSSQGKAFESRELLIFQFYDGRYKILSDIRNHYAAVEKGARFGSHEQDLLSRIENVILPQRFWEKGFNISTSISFHIDESGKWEYNPEAFTERVRISEDEKILHRQLVTLFEQLNGQWQPAVRNGAPAAQHFIGFFTIRNGQPKFRLLSHNWVYE